MSILKEINRFYYYMSLHELQVMNESDYYNGLSYNSLLYLNVIEQVPDCTVSKLARLLCVSKAAVTLKINELEKAGVIRKEQSMEDKRVYHIRLTERMERIYEGYDEIFKKVEEKLKESFPEEELRSFENILRTASGYEWRKLSE